MFRTFRSWAVVAVCLVGVSLSAGESPRTSAVAPRFRVLIASNPGMIQMVLQAQKPSDGVLYFQTPDGTLAEDLRRRIHKTGLLGSHVYVEHGPLNRIHLAQNIADVIFFTEDDHKDPPLYELLRVIRPHGEISTGLNPDKSTKAVSPRAGQWTHPYHGPDNNPQSEDKLARPPYQTQFLAEPYYVPFPEVTVAAGGRVFKAFGHVGYKQRDWPWLNKLVAFNAYNGMQLWQRPLEEGFNIHRNTMIATDDALFVADSKSCKQLDPATGEAKLGITIPADGGGPVWKWMALDGGVLYALLGGEEPRDETLRGEKRAAGWPWQPMTRMYDDRNYRWGFGQTLLAIDPKDGRILWRHTEDAPIDGRAIAMSGGRIFYYSEGRFLACRAAADGKLQWRNSDATLLEAIGPSLRAQSYVNGFSTTAYMKCSDKAIYFAGPQRARLVAASTADGRLLWQHPHGNFQLVLRDEGLYALGKTGPSKLFDPLSGETKADLPALRGNCTRATGAVDCIYARGDNHGGTLRLTVPDNKPFRIPLMRPDCHDGVIVANGLMYWGPWMCDCNLSLVGLIAVGPAEKDVKYPPSDAAERHIISPLPRAGEASGVRVGRLILDPADWPAYRADNHRGGYVPATIAAEAKKLWSHKWPGRVDAAAPIAAGGLAFLSGSDGAIEARDAASGEVRWTRFTGGPILFPPAVADGRLVVGSGDGWVYAFDAATGHDLWRFRAAPIERKIMVYGRLMSTWPVASGVLVDGDTVYAAAGLTSYDGTYIYALDAADGRVKWTNDSSSALHAPDHFSGVSVQGHLLLDGDTLYMAGGNVASPAMYETKSGKCLNTLPNEWVKAPRGRDLYRIAGKVVAFERLLYAPKEYWPGRYFARNLLQADNGDLAIRWVDGQLLRVAAAEPDSKTPKAVWKNGLFRQANALAMGRNAVVVGGQLADAGHAIAAFDLADGRELWRQPLAAMPVQWGIAIDAAGRVVVTTEGGEAVAFGQ